MLTREMPTRKTAAVVAMHVDAARGERASATAEPLWQTRGWLVAELVVLFGLVPVALMQKLLPVHPLAVAAVAASGCLLFLLRDPTFDASFLWNGRDLARRLLATLPVWLLTVGLLFGVLCLVSPDRLFDMPRHHTAVWAVLMLSYPIISVYPQELIYRSFFFHRYKPVAGDGWPMVLLSAVAFAWMHVLFNNWVAVGLCAAGGVIFAWRYRRTRSLLVTSVEHTLYGQLVFTIGLGEFLLSGTLPTAGG
jgi:membrane protease YdiL (CAAX protease family)